MISINRLYVGTGEERKYLLNPKYIISIETVESGTKSGLVRIVMDTKKKEEADIVYTRDKITTIESRINKTR